ncbi:nucleoside hydrolase [Luteolibacter sp. GHJ8]|uniref:Nucleoside hydrolase n=1 Tax=Luteolibacter rhizosphaerae TaxID=2989719 RepID=A0ABT3G9P3_9BACT|nr:nucleoside hydrolase [Luteolibacter rhizosphaerae]MCW1916567.1 nucleoside hydrolase [Luteolibacter rhizosphaerae]
MACSQLAHQLLSPSVKVRGIIGSHHYPGGFFSYSGAPEEACKAAKELLEVMGLGGKVPVHQGAKERIGEDGAARPSDAARFIVQEAMREDVKTPLFIACGAGLTDLASAYLLEPAIGKRIRLIWIGGHEHEGIATPPPGGQRIEYNLGIDLRAGQIVFNQSDIPVWQVPRDAYRQALVSTAELEMRMNDGGKLAGFLNARLQELMTRAYRDTVETYVLGDSPLVLLTALQSPWEADPASSRYLKLPTPRINGDGRYDANPQGREMRVYTQIDSRLMFEDFYAKLALFSRQGGEGE